MPADHVVVGLGNPGAQYRHTRHNVGFDVVEELARRHGGSLRKTKDRALADQVRMAGATVLLAEPQTYMNESGVAVRPLCKHAGITDWERLVVVHDELDLPLGKLKVKIGGGLAGHNGLRSIKAHLHTDAFVRVRIGVGKPQTKEHGADHVLSKVGGPTKRLLEEMVAIAADAVECIVADGPVVAMDRFNNTDRT